MLFKLGLKFGKLHRFWLCYIWVFIFLVLVLLSTCHVLTTISNWGLWDMYIKFSSHLNREIRWQWKKVSTRCRQSQMYKKIGGIAEKCRNLIKRNNWTHATFFCPFALNLSNGTWNFFKNRKNPNLEWEHFFFKALMTILEHNTIYYSILDTWYRHSNIQLAIHVLFYPFLQQPVAVIRLIFVRIQWKHLNFQIESIKRFVNTLLYHRICARNVNRRIYANWFSVFFFI